MRASTRYAVYIGAERPGLPDRDYYLKKDDAKMASALAKYELHVGKILAGRRPQAAANAKKIVALETALAEVQWTKVENRDPVKRYNKMPSSSWPNWRPATTGAMRWPQPAWPTRSAT
jgi:predicted metalloendopeptidase